MNYETQTSSLSRLRRFLAWPSGAIASVLSACPSEHNYYCGLGVLVWFNSLLAGSGMALMLSQTTDSSAKALAGGAFWFLCILNLDRFLLLASYENTGWKKLMPVSRVLLSLCLAIIIGEHVVQFIFHNEINNQLAQEKLDAHKSNYDNALKGIPEIAALSDDKTRKQDEIERAKAEVSKLRADYIGEAEGIAGSHIKGKGPLYEQKERDYNVALAEKQKLENELQQIQNRLDTKNQELKTTVDLADAAKAKDRGFLAYHRALFEIIKHDPTLLFLYLVISSAMILFEITPLFSKLGGKDRLHDLLAGKEAEFKRSVEDGLHQARLRRSRDEMVSEAAVIDGVQQLQRETLDELMRAIRNNTQSNLSPEKARLAKSLTARVYRNIMSQVQQNDLLREDARSGETSDSGNDPGEPASVAVIMREGEAGQPFTIIFREPRERVKGSDLMYTLAGLNTESPAGTEPIIPLSDYIVTNDLGESIQPDLPLFSQISGNTVYLSRFGPTVSHAQN
jgi:uncharacterized membrane-anchored protein YhcB (DUF1043 family)